MSVAVIGCGAMGSVYAGLLAHAGNPVVAISRWQDHVDAITTDGLRVEGASGDRRVAMRARTSAPNEVVDLVVIATKAPDVAAAAEQAMRMVGDRTRVLTIQNGLGSAEAVARVLGGERLIVGIAAGFGASLRGPGHAHHANMRSIRMGMWDQQSAAAADVATVAAVWRQAGFVAEAVDDIVAMQWEKLVCNVAYSGPCALTGMTVGEAMDDPDIGPLSRAAAVEAYEVARARDVAIDIDDPVSHVRAFGTAVADAHPSVLLDHQRGRASEIDVINGAVPREAERAGRSAPVNATIAALVKHRERDFRH